MALDLSPELERMVNALALGEGFQFHIAECFSPRQVVELLALLAEQVPVLSGVSLRLEHLWPYAASLKGLPPDTLALGAWLTEKMTNLPPCQNGERQVLVLDATGGRRADEEVWCQLFRRLNEQRNTLVKQWDMVLLLCIPPSLYRAFAREAPDFWSIRSESISLLSDEAAQHAPPRRIFMAHCLEDAAWATRIESQLKYYAEADIEVWSEQNLLAGSTWSEQLDAVLSRCQAALLLVSSRLLTSRLIHEVEVPALLRQWARRGLAVIPVILEPCRWQLLAWLAAFQVWPADGKPLNGMGPEDKLDAALADLADDVRRLVLARREVAIDLAHLPAAAPHFLGRTGELAQLDSAWSDRGRAAIVELIAPGGSGKTALINHWLDRMRADNWRGAEKIFGWSFYSQGAGEDRQASDDAFFSAAIEFFSLDLAPSAAVWDKGVVLARALGKQRMLLVLDGLEPLQYPPTDKALPGELKAPSLKALLQTLARNGSQSLVLVSSREKLADLDGWLRSPEQPHAGVSLLDLGNLSDADGARLLHKLGVNHAGPAAIAENDTELRTVSRALNGHALTLSLVGTYLARAKGGDVRRWLELDYARANDKSLKGHAFHAIAAYDTWFAREGEAGARERAALRLLGFFDRPASRALLAVLSAAPAIPSLTGALVNFDGDDWTITLSHLSELGLVQLDAFTGSLDAHPLVREYFAHRLQSQQPEAWREGHQRLYQHLTRTTPQFPNTLEGLQPLYQAVAHGCKAGLVQDACTKVYRDRIQRGGEAFSTDKLGAFGADLGAVAGFFVEPWRRLAPSLSQPAQAWLLNEAAIRLRALGRLSEALEPIKAASRMAVKQEDMGHAAIGYSNLSELQLTLGRIAEAVADARQAASYADRSGAAFQRMTSRATLADALHQGGEVEEARYLFAEAEAIQRERQPQYPLFYSLPGFRYCDWLLAPVERAAMAVYLTVLVARRSAASPGTVSVTTPCPGLGLTASYGLLEALPSTTATGPGADLEAVVQRATDAQKIAIRNNWLLDIALDHLTLARCALYADLLQGLAPGQEAQDYSQAALSGLRAAGAQHHIPRGLLTRALLYHALGRTAETQADLAEAEDIARRGGMKLLLADIALHRARLFADRDALTQARKLIEECGYGRRLAELEDAEAAFNHA